MRNITDKGLSLIKSSEKLVLTTYICPAGYPTIGYGHVVKASEAESFAGGITEAHAEELLRQDVVSAQRAVLRLIRVPLSDGQFDALVSFTFNLGGGALQRSTLRRKLNRGDYESIPAELMKWVWAGGRKLKGLVVRRRSESIMFS
jgi:GH24 family phage-related lysozyme (muramidase)